MTFSSLSGDGGLLLVPPCAARDSPAPARPGAARRWLTRPARRRPAVATRYGKRGCMYQAAVDLAPMRICGYETPRRMSRSPQPAGGGPPGSTADAVADVGGLRRVDHPGDLQLDVRRQGAGFGEDNEIRKADLVESSALSAWAGHLKDRPGVARAVSRGDGGHARHAGKGAEEIRCGHDCRRRQLLAGRARWEVIGDKH